MNSCAWPYPVQQVSGTINNTLHLYIYSLVPGVSDGNYISIVHPTLIDTGQPVNKGKTNGSMCTHINGSMCAHINEPMSTNYK